MIEQSAWHIGSAYFVGFGNAAKRMCKDSKLGYSNGGDSIEKDIIPSKELGL